jgi:serine/threonine-protein kinase
MATDARIGSELAGYRIEAPIGRGGMGIVYRAEHLRLGRKVALKLLAPELAENQGFRARFEHESRLAAALDHPNIVPLFEAGEADGLLFIAMRYVEGTDLRAALTSHGRLEPERALAIAAQVGSALDAAHTRGLVHRDVKPGNILIAAGSGVELPEHCYLTDFGLTKDTSSPVELTATGTFVGTIDYIAPEQIEGAKPDGRGDQYALACVLFECLTGHPPFPRDEEIVVMWAHLQDEPPTVTADRPELPAAIDAVIARAMAKSPKARFATCTAMVAAARAALIPGSVIAPAAVTRAHASPAAPAGATRAASAIPAPPLAAPPLAAPPAGVSARAPQTVAPERAVVPASRTPLIALALVLMAVAAVGGVLVGAGGGEKKVAPTGQTATAGALELRFGSRWTAGGTGDIVPGLTLSDPIALRSGDARIVAGRIAHPGPGLLPAVVKPPGATDAVTLGATPALRHAAVPAGAGALATVFVVPTANGVHALACVGATGSDCEAVAGTLRVRGAAALDVRPSAGYATRLTDLLGARARRDALYRGRLARAGTSRAQAAVADGARAGHARFASLAGALRPPQVARSANAAVVAAVAAIGRGYEDVAAAARAHDRARYRDAQAALSTGHARLVSAVHALGLLGYQVQDNG